jgi:hypothetical protein
MQVMEREYLVQEDFQRLGVSTHPLSKWPRTVGRVRRLVVAEELRAENARMMTS